MAIRPGVFALSLLVLPAPRAVEAQGLASPFGTVSQRVDSTTISLEYYRPSVRGRAIFGSLIRWGRLWTPGANWATTLEVNHDVTIEGLPLPAGKYSIWMLPGPDSFVVTLSRAARRFHVQHPGPEDEQLRFGVRPDSIAPVELLAFAFPEVTPDGATLRFQWADRSVPMRIQVHARAEIVAAHPLGSYAGVYTIDGMRYEIILEGTRLRVKADKGAVEEGLDAEFDLVPAGGDGFHQRQYKNGVLVGTEMDELLTFQFEGGRATGFEIRGVAENKVLARATRVP